MSAHSPVPVGHSSVAAIISERHLDVALEAAFASGKRTIVIPAGTYLVGRTLRIPSGATLRASSEAIIKLADGAANTADDFLLANADQEAGNAQIMIEGGVWDGNNRFNVRPTGLFDKGYTGAVFHFQNVRGLTLRDMTLRNAEAYYTRYTHVHDFTIEDIRFDSDHVRNNNDGIHIGGNCSHGVIRKIRGLRPGVTGDDMVALNADDALQRTEVRGMTSGPIADLTIEDLQAEDCHSFVRLLSVWSPISRISVRNVRGTCAIAAINADAGRGTRVPLFDENNPPFPDGVGRLEDVDIADFEVAKSQPNEIALLRLETRMKNFRIARFKRIKDVDRSPSHPTLRLGHVPGSEVHIDGRTTRVESGKLELMDWSFDALAIR